MSTKVYPVSNYKDYRGTKNPYGEKIREFNAAGKFTLLADDQTEEHRGAWQAYQGLPPDAPLNLELGAYHGETSIALAKGSPNTCHLGVEWKYKMCFKAGKKAADQNLKNLTFLRANMARLPWVLKPQSVDRIWVLFPDPWAKASHQKWRVLHPGFLRLLGNLLKEGKELMIKTDHADYAEYIKESIKEAGGYDYFPEEEAQKIWSMIPPTPFERIFIRQGLKINCFALRRNAEKLVAPEEVQEILARP
jgi:tRNA (guanine-N7-)-methyltransferase